MPLTTTIATIAEAAAEPSIGRFLREAPFAAYQQSLAWPDVAPRRARHDFVVAIVRERTAIRGAAVIRRSRLAPGRWLATIQRGPVVHRAEDLGRVVAALLPGLSAAGCCSLQLAPRVRGRDLPEAAEALRHAGFSPLPEDRQPLHRATGIVWLDKAEDAVFAGFKQRGRRQIRAAERAGVTVRTVEGAADVAAYQRVIDVFAAARPDYDMSGLPDAAGQARLIAAEGGAMLLAEREGQVIGGHAFVRQADEAIWLSLVATDDVPEVPRNYLLLWEAMRRARDMGAIAYDLAGIPVEDPADAGEAGRHQFKAAFAPTRRILLPMQVRALRPASHLMLFGARNLYRGWKRRRRVAA